jgi:hypothetical protein
MTIGDEKELRADFGLPEVERSFTKLFARDTAPKVGDEKVVAWLLDSGGNRTYWADEETARKEYGNLCVLGYRSDTTLTSLIPHSAYAELAAELAEVRSERDAFAKYNDLLTHKVITCGVAAHHPDPNLSKTGAYAAKWDSPQARDVRALRDRCDAAESQLAELRGSLVELADKYETYYPRYASRNVIGKLRALAAADGGGE